MKNKKFSINPATVNQPAKLAPLIATAMAIVTQGMQVVGYAAGFNPEGAVKTIVDWVTWIILGIGVVIFMFNLVGVFQAHEADDSERQKKKLGGVFVGVGMCCVKPAAVILLKAVSGSDNEAIKYFE